MDLVSTHPIADELFALGDVQAGFTSSSGRAARAWRDHDYYLALTQSRVTSRHFLSSPGSRIRVQRAHGGGAATSRHFPAPPQQLGQCPFDVPEPCRDTEKASAMKSALASMCR